MLAIHLGFPGCVAYPGGLSRPAGERFKLRRNVSRAFFSERVVTALARAAPNTSSGPGTPEVDGGLAAQERRGRFDRAPISAPASVVK